MVKLLKLADILIGAGTQIRVRPDSDTIEQYADAMLDTANKFPPVVVFFDGSDYIMADGFHRFLAATRNQFKDIEADVRTGSRVDALRFALGANATHGLKRNNADKRRAVEMAFVEWPKLSDRDIAKMCQVSHTFVSGMKGPSGNVATVSSSESTKPPQKTSLTPPVPQGPPQGPTPTPKATNSGPPPSPSRPPSGPPPKPPKPEPVLDKIGREIPTDCLGVWNRAGEVQSYMQTISTLRGAFRQADKDKDLLYAGVNLSTLEASLGQAYFTLKTAVPYTVCSSCQGKLARNCRLCHGRGMISEHLWETAIPESQRNIILKTCCAK